MAEFISPDEQDLCLLAEDGRKSSVDNRTLMNTPAPMASSTVVRPTNLMNRLQGESAIHNSYLEDGSTPRGLGSRGTFRRHLVADDLMDGSLPAGAPGQSNHSGWSVEDGVHEMSDAGNASSLGLLQLDDMPDLSASIIMVNDNQSSQGGSIFTNEETPRARKQPDRLESTSDSTIHQSVGSCAGVQTVVKASQPPRNLSISSMTSQSSVQRLPARALFTKEDSDATNAQKDRSTEKAQFRMDNILALALNRVSSGSLQDDPDHDMSVHEVKLEMSDLEQLEDDFSDIGDFDVTEAAEDDDGVASHHHHHHLHPKLLMQANSSGSEYGIVHNPESELTFSALPAEDTDGPQRLIGNHSLGGIDTGIHCMAGEPKCNGAKQNAGQNQGHGEQMNQSATQPACTSHLLDSIYLRSTEGDTALSQSTGGHSTSMPRSSNIFGESTMGGSQMSARESGILFDETTQSRGDCYGFQSGEGVGGGHDTEQASRGVGTTMDVLRGLGLMGHGSQQPFPWAQQEPDDGFEKSEGNDEVTVLTHQQLASGHLLSSNSNGLPYERKVRFASTDGYKSVTPRSSGETCPDQLTPDFIQDSPPIGQEMQTADWSFDAANDHLPAGPVYLDENGEGVTDLAFKYPLPTDMLNPFDSSPTAGLSGFGDTQQGLSFDEDILGDTGEFLSAEAAIAKLDDDEDVFQKENVFTQEEVMDEVQSPLQQDSWAIHSHLSLGQTSDPWQDSPELRVSIGTFMRGRTETLGSLDGELMASRPTFGCQVVSSPTGRTLHPLISLEENDLKADLSPPNSGKQSSPSHRPGSKLPVPTPPSLDKPHSPKHTLSPDSPHHDHTLTTSDLAKDKQSPPGKLSKENGNQDIRLQSVDPMQEKRQGDPKGHLDKPVHSMTLQESILPSVTPDEPRLDMPKERSIDVSSVTKFILSGAVDINPDELVQTILQMSEKKSTSDSKPEKASHSENKENASLSQQLPKQKGEESVVSKITNQPMMNKESKRSSQTSNGRLNKGGTKTVLAPSNKNTSDVSVVPPSNNLTRSQVGSVNHSLEQEAYTGSYKIRPKDNNSSQHVASHMTETSGKRQQNANEGERRVGKGGKSDNTTKNKTGSKIPTYKGKIKPCGEARKPTLEKNKVKVTNRVSDTAPKSRLSQGESNIKASEVVRSEVPPQSLGSGEVKQLDQRLSGGSSNGSEGQASSGSVGQWMSPRPSSVMTRHNSQLADSIQVNNNNNWMGSPDSGNAGDLSHTSSQGDPSIAVVNGPSTPKDATVPGKVLSRNRMSSTPKRPVGNFTINVTSQDSISHIDPSPQARLNFAEDSPSAIWSSQPTPDATPPEDRVHPDRLTMDKAPPNENNAGYFQSTAANDGYLVEKPVKSFQHGLLPSHPRITSESSTKPTLLTSQPLSTTAFASHYLPQATSTSSLRSQTVSDSIASAAVLSAPTTSLLPPRQTDPTMSNASSYTSLPAHRFMPEEGPKLDIPLEVVMPEVCCVGLSTQCSIPISNPTSRWVHATLRIHSISVDGRDIDCETGLPFVLKEKVIVEPNTTENVKVIFVPRHVGAFVAQLHIHASPLVSDLGQRLALPESVPTMVTLQGIAENPLVQVVTEGASHLLDFGELPWGSHKSMPVTLVNRGRCKVPIRLLISTNEIPRNLFSLEKPLNTTISSSLTSPGSSRPSPNKPSPSCLTLPPALSASDVHPRHVQVYFQAPSKHNPSGAAVAEYSGSIDFEVDSPSGYHSLGSVGLVATAGTAKLHTPRSLEMLRLQAAAGRHDSVTFPVRNAGSIALSVALETTDAAGTFTIEPKRLVVRSGTEAKITVLFDPSRQTPAGKIDSMLLMTVEPEGPGYEMLLQGIITSNQGVSVPRGVDPVYNPTILTNKQQLCWGGVALDKAACETIVMKHEGSKDFKVRLIIYGDTSVFKMKKVTGAKSSLCTAMEVVLQPQEEYALHTYFTPTAVNSFQGQLKVKPMHGPVAYSVPLSGYGGLSQLTIENMHTGLGHNNSYWNKLGPLTTRNTRTLNVRVLNKGQRAAYIKVKGFQDLTCKAELSQTVLFADPSELCLKPGKSHVYTVVLNPTQQQSHLCSSQAAIVANLAFFYGDELARHKLRRALKKNPDAVSVPLAKDNPAKAIDFTKPFLYEDELHHDMEMKSCDADVELFYISMSKLTLALVGEPPIPRSAVTLSHDPAGQRDLYSTAPTRPLQEVTGGGGKPPSRKGPVENDAVAGETKRGMAPEGMRWEDADNEAIYQLTKGTCQALTQPTHTSSVPANTISKSSTAPVLTTAEARSDKETGSRGWAVKPEQILLTAATQSGEETPLKKIELVNFTSRPLTFDLAIPSHCLIVSPEHGTVQPKSCSSICLSPSPHLQRRGVHLPWQGTVYVHVDGKIKIIDVQIHEQLPSLSEAPAPCIPTTLVTVPPAVTTLTATSGNKLHHSHPASVSQALSMTSSTGTKNRLLDISPSTLQFADCDSDKQTLRVKIKNRDTVSHKVKIVQPAGPFSVKRSSLDILPLHYVRLPVEFCPPKRSKPGCCQYQSLLVLIHDSGETFQIVLLAEISHH